MSFKTMDGVEVYDKSDIDNIITPIQQDATEAKQIATAISSRKLDKSQATLEFAADRERLSNLESDKADKSEVAGIVNSTIDGVINAKVASITSDINHIIDNAIDDELEDYDNVAQTTQKTADAINNALTNYDSKATVDRKISDAVEATTATCSAAINDALTSYDNKAAVDQKISDAVEAAVATRPVAMTTAEATSLIDQYF